MSNAAFYVLALTKLRQYTVATEELNKLGDLDASEHTEQSPSGTFGLGANFQNLSAPAASCNLEGHTLRMTCYCHYESEEVGLPCWLVVLLSPSAWWSWELPWNQQLLLRRACMVSLRVICVKCVWISSGQASCSCYQIQASQDSCHDEDCKSKVSHEL